jgi:cytosine/uracil/thiamine/allantoin permease
LSIPSAITFALFWVLDIWIVRTGGLTTGMLSVAMMPWKLLANPDANIDNG